MRKCDNENMGSTKLKLGFGKSFSTSCVWLCDTIEAFSDEKALLNQMRRYGTIKNHVFVRDHKGSALIFYETSEDARNAVEDLRNKFINGRKIQVDFASRDFQAYFLGKHVKPEDTHRNSSSMNSWSGNNSSLDYDDRMYESSRNRNISSYHHHQSTPRTTSISSQFRSNNSSGLNSSYSNRQRSQSPTSSPANLNSFSFSRSQTSQSNSSSLHGSSRLSKYDYHHDSSIRSSSRQPYRYDLDDEDLGEDSHLSSSSKRDSSRYRSHHISDNYLTDSSPKLRRDTSPFFAYGANNKLDADLNFHRSNRSLNDDVLKSHDDTHGSIRRMNHSKSYHKSGRDSPSLPASHSASQFRKSGLASSSSSTSSCSRSPVRDVKSSSHYPDRTSSSPSTSPRTNAYSSYHDSDRAIDSSLNDSMKVEKEYNSSSQWRRKSTEDSVHHRDHTNADLQRVRSESISEAGEFNNNNNCSTTSSLNSHRDHSRDYIRDRFRESHSSRTSSTVSPSSNLTYQNRSDLQLKRKFLSAADSEDFTDISGHLERKKRLLACIEQSSALSSSNQTSTTTVTTTSSSSNAVTATTKSNCVDQRVTSNSVELNGSKPKIRDVFSTSVDSLLKRRSSSSSSSSSVVNNLPTGNTTTSLTSGGNNGSNVNASLNDLKSNAKSSDMMNLIEQIIASGDESGVAVLNFFQNNPDSNSLNIQNFVRSKLSSQSSTTSLNSGGSLYSKPKSGIAKESSCPSSGQLRVVDCNEPVNSKSIDPRLSGHSARRSSIRTSCDNDLSMHKASESSTTSRSYGPSSPMSLPLPDFWFSLSRHNSCSTETKAATVSAASSSSISTAATTTGSSSVVSCNSISTTTSTTNSVTTSTTTAPSVTLTHINIPNFTTTSPKSINIMSPLGNLSPVPKSRLSLDRMSTETNCFETKKSSTDLEDVSDSDISPLRTTSLDDRLKAFDEKYNAWSGTATVAKSEAKTPTIDYSKYNIKKKSTVISGSTNSNSTSNQADNESTDLIKNLLSKSSVFDGDSKRLEHIFDVKNESKETTKPDLTAESLYSPKSKSSMLVSKNKLASSASKEFVITGSTQLLSNSLLPTEKSSLDSLPKSTSSTSSSSVPLASPSLHHSAHHPLHTTSSSHSNTISTLTNSISRKFPDSTRVRKDGTLGTTSTPSTPSSAPLRSNTSSMFPQFSRSSSIPSANATANSNFARTSSNHPLKDNQSTNTVASNVSANSKPKSDYSLSKSNSLSNSIPNKDVSFKANTCASSKPSLQAAKKDTAITASAVAAAKHNQAKLDYYKSKYETSRAEFMNRKSSDSSLDHNSLSNTDSEFLSKEQCKSRSGDSVPTKHSMKEVSKEEMKEQKKADKSEKLKDRDTSVNSSSHHNSVNMKERKNEKNILKEKKKNKDKFKDKEHQKDGTKEQKQKSKMEKRELKERTKGEKKRVKHKKENREMEFEAPTYFLSMYDKVKARSSANQNLKVASNCQKLNQLKDKRQHNKNDKSSEDSESDSDDSSDDKIIKQKRFKKRKVIIDSSDLSSDDETPVRRNRIFSNDSESDKCEKKKLSTQNCLKKESSFKWEDDSDDDDDSPFGETKLKPTTKESYSRKPIDTLHFESSDYENDVKEKIQMKKRKKNKDKERGNESHSSVNKFDYKNESNDKSDKSCDKGKDHQKAKMKSSKKDGGEKVKEKRIKSEDDEHKVMKMGKKKKKKPKLSKEKKHGFTKEERDSKSHNENNKLFRMDISSDLDSDSSGFADIDRKRRIADSDSDNDTRSHFIQCYNKDPKKRMNDDYPKKAKHNAKMNSLDKDDKQLAKMSQKLEKMFGDSSPTKKKSKSELKTPSIKVEDDECIREVRKKKKKSKDKNHVRKDSESSDSKKESLFGDSVFKLTSPKTSSLNCDLRLSPDTIHLSLPKTPEICHSRSPSYADAHHDDGSSSDSKIDEELCRLGDRVECRIANNDDSLSDSNLSRPDSPLHSSKALNSTGLCNLLQPLVNATLTDSSLDNNSFHTPKRSFEDEAAIQSLKLQKELETLDTKTPDILIKPTFEAPPFARFTAAVEKPSPIEENTYSVANATVEIEKVDKIFPIPEIETKTEDPVKPEFNEIDSQRKIEDALAVEALLQDMNVPCVHQVPSVHDSNESTSTELPNPEFILANTDIQTVVPIEVPLEIESTVVTTTDTPVAIVSEVIVDEQELKAAVQEIELPTSLEVETNKIPVKSEAAAPTETSVITTTTTNEIMFNDDDDEIESDLMIDESVIDKSLQDDSCEVVEFDTSARRVDTGCYSGRNLDHSNFEFDLKSTDDKKDIHAQHHRSMETTGGSKPSDVENNVFPPTTEYLRKTNLHTGLPNETEKKANQTDKNEETHHRITVFEESGSKLAPTGDKDSSFHHDERYLNNEAKNKESVKPPHQEETSETECEATTTSKPKRGRRAKNRKNSDSSMHSPRSEHSSNEQNSATATLSINTNLSGTPNQLLSPSSLSPNTTSNFSDTSPGSQAKRGKQQHSGAGVAVAAGGGFAGTRRSVRTAAVVATVANTSTVLEELEENDFSHDDQQATTEHDDEQGVKKPSKRGRKKKIANAETTPAKTVPDDGSKKDRLHVPASEPRLKSSNSPYDVFEFRDSDEDEPIILDSIKSSSHFMSSNIAEEKRHPEATSEAEAAKQTETPITPNSAATPADVHNFNSNSNASGTKEYVSEVSQNKIGITIRLQPKDGQEGGLVLPETVKPRNLSTEDSKSNDSTTQLAQTPANLLAESSNSKAVRKSARLMSQVPKTTIEDTIEDVIKTCNNKTETEKGSYKRITRSYRKSDDSQQQSTQDSQDEQDGRCHCFILTSLMDFVLDSRAMRAHRTTRSRAVTSDSSDVSDVSQPRSNTGTVVVTKKLPESIDEPNDETNPPTETSSAPKEESSMNSEAPEEPTVHVPAPSSVIQSTGNVEKLTTISTAPTIIPAASNTSVITSVASSIYPPTVITSPDYLQDIPNLSERIHQSSTPLKLKTGKGLIFDDFKAPIVVNNSASTEASTAVTPSTPSVITTHQPKVEPITPTPPISQSITIKPKYQPPVGQLSQPELWSAPTAVPIPSPSLSTTAKISPYPSTISLAPSEPSADQPPPAHLPKLSRTSPSVIDSMKVLNMSTTSSTANKVPTTTVATTAASKILFNKPCLQVASSPQPAHEVQHPYPANILPAHSHLHDAYLSVLQKQQLLGTQPVTPNLVGKHESEFDLTVPHIASEFQQQNAPSPALLPPHYPVLPPHMRPQALTNEALEAVKYYQSVYGPRGPIALSSRFLYGPNFPAHAIAPESLVQLEQQKHAAAKSSKDDVHPQQIADERRHSTPDLAHHIPSLPRNVAYPGNNLRHPYPFLLGHDRFADQSIVNYVVNGQARNLTHPSHGFNSPSATDLSKHIESGEPKRSPSVKLNLQDPVYLQQLHRQLPSPRAHSPAYVKDLSALAESQDLIRAQINAAVASQFGQPPKDLVTPPNSIPLNMSTHSIQRPPSRPASTLHHSINRPADLSEPRPQHPYVGSEPPYISPSPAHSISPTSNAANYSQTPQHVLLEKYPLTWQGLLSLKNDQVCIQMHYVSGAREIAQRALSSYDDQSTTPLRITQRMRIDHIQLQGLERRIQVRVIAHGLTFPLLISLYAFIYSLMGIIVS